MGVVRLDTTADSSSSSSALSYDLDTPDDGRSPVASPKSRSGDSPGGASACSKGRATPRIRPRYSTKKSGLGRLSTLGAAGQETSAGDDADGEEQKPIADKKDPCAGLFTDYLERTKAARMQAATRSSAVAMESYAEFNQEVHCEMLEDDLTHAIIIWKRQLRDQLWIPIKSQRFKDRAWAIVAAKRRKRLLAAGVQQYVERHAKGHDLRPKAKQPATNRMESRDDRHNRLQEFFRDYHQSSSRADLRRPHSRGRLRFVDSCPEEAHSAFAHAWGQDERDMEDAKRSLRIESGYPPLPIKVDAWKLRSAGLKKRRDRLPSHPTITPPVAVPTKTIPEGGAPKSAGGLRRQGTGTSGRSTPTTASGGWGLAGRSSRPNTPECPGVTVASQRRLAMSIGDAARGTAIADWISNSSQPAAFERTESSTRGLVRSGSSTALGRPGSQPAKTRHKFVGAVRPESAAGRRAAAVACPPLLPTTPVHTQSAPVLPAATQTQVQVRGESGPSATEKPHNAVVVHEDSNQKRLPRRERKAFVSPWRDGKQACAGDPAAKERGRSASRTSTDTYLREAELNCICPLLIPFVTGHSDSLAAGNQALNDCDLLVIGTTLTGRTDLRNVDLTGNALLTERSLVPFLQKIAGQPVEQLSLKQCLRNALPPGIQETIDAVGTLLTAPTGLPLLRELDLGGIRIGMRAQVPICRAIQQHPCLRDVRLADTGIGGAVAQQCIKWLTGSASVQVLDLSWNSFSLEALALLGELLAANECLRSLSLANCSSSQSNLDNPIAYFMEALGHNSSLNYLDISLNRVGFSAALVLEDALQGHRQLSELQVSNNPLGVLGLRCLLRLLSYDTSGLMHFSSEGCTGGTIMEAMSEDMHVFSAANPSGRYRLNLQRPYHRSLLRMLYKTCERWHLPPEVAFTDINCNKRTYVHPGKGEDGFYAVAREGALSFNFGIESAAAAAPDGGPFAGISAEAFGHFCNCYHSMARLRPTGRKLVPLLACWKSVDGHTEEQQDMLDALSKDFGLGGAEVEQFCASRQSITDILSHLAPCMANAVPAFFLASRLTVAIGEYAKHHKNLRNLEVLNVENPTGHYKLDLANPADFSVAEDLILLDRWETGISVRLDRFDTSQRNNRSSFRNEKHQELPLQGVHAVGEWRLPEWDTLEFDYSSGKRPPADAVELDADAHLTILVHMQQSESPPADQVHALRKVSHHIYLNSIQMRQLLGVMKSQDDRMELLIVLFMRITDIYNEKIYRVRFSVQEVQRLRDRLGHVTYFPFMQPEQTHFEFNLFYYDQRLALVIVLTLNNRESAGNIRDYHFVNADGTEDDMPLGVPRSWEYLDRVPKEGVFRCVYACSPEDRKTQYRTKLIHKYGFWLGPENEDQVNWWAAINEAPEAVVDFLDFLVSRYEDVHEAFVVIEGKDGSGAVSLRQFEEGVVYRLKCHKFKAKTQEVEIQTIFRYLDSSGEGRVSAPEWQILDQLFKEMQLSIYEFCDFLGRTFDSLQSAWDYLDTDQSGDLSVDEWEAAVESIGYFGPAKPIFSYLDKDDEGTVSLDEFEALENFRVRPGARSPSACS